MAGSGIGLSESQLGLWALQRLYPETSAYNVPMAFAVEHVDAEALRRAAACVVERYPVLGRRIVETSAGPSVEAAPGRATFVEGHPAGWDRHGLSFLRARAARPFDLASSAPIRFELIRRAGADEATVMIVAHHIAIDGLSATILSQAFWEAYAHFAGGGGPQTAPMPTDYLEFVAFERAYLASKTARADLAYWKDVLSGELPRVSLPADRALRPGGSHVPASCERVLDADFVRSVCAAAKAMRVNRPALFLGVLTILLHRYARADDIVIGVPVLGRPETRFRRECRLLRQHDRRAHSGLCG